MPIADFSKKGLRVYALMRWAHTLYYYYCNHIHIQIHNHVHVQVHVHIHIQIQIQIHIQIHIHSANACKKQYIGFCTPLVFFCARLCPLVVCCALLSASRCYCVQLCKSLYNNNLHSILRQFDARVTWRVFCFFL